MNRELIDNLQKYSEYLILDTEEYSEEAMRKTLEFYILFLSLTEKEIASFISKYGKDNIVPYTEIRRRLTDKERKVFNAELKDWYKFARENKLDSEYIAYLQQLGQKSYITRYEYLQANLRQHVEKLYFDIENMLSESFKDIYSYSYYVNKYNFTKATGVELKFIDLGDNDLENAINRKVVNTTYKNSLKNGKTRLLNDLETGLQQGIARGFDVKKLQAIVDSKAVTAKNRTIALTRTETNYLANMATLKMYRELDVDKYQYLATLDTRTSDMCRDMDGYIGKVSQAEIGVNYPPIHVHCRSTTIPYIEKLADFSDRVAKNMEGKNISVPRRMTQEEYIKKYVPADQQARLLRFKNRYRQGK